LDCADISALWNDATCRVEESGVKPPQSKVCRVLKAIQYQMQLQTIMPAARRKAAQLATAKLQQLRSAN